jgi:parallel beta-helix repeat protein
MLRNSLIALIACAAIVLGISSPKAAEARTSAAASSPFLVTSLGGGNYRARSLSTSSVYNGTLKSVVESAAGELESGGGGEVRFVAGTFDLGSDYFKLEQIHNIVFDGAGIDATVIQNSSSDASDTEPFNFSGAFGVTVKDMTVAAGGPNRSTSDALDFDQGNNSVVDHVKVSDSRGRGIVFDGKDDSWTSAGNVVRDCVIDGVPESGIELLASTDNLVERCTITNVGRHGISVTKSSPSATQPNKKSDNNTIRENVIDNSGIHGIFVNSSDDNRILSNQVRNSSNNVASADGIQITSNDSIACDDNVVDGNVATDTQSPKTQRYGLNIASSLCHQTVVGGSNDFSGNRVGAINDLGTGTIFGADSVPPTAPQSLTADPFYKTQVDLAWTASTDSVGVTGYEIWRDGALLQALGVQTAYSDTTVAPGSTHSYQVRARDGAGNFSGFSNTVSATTPASGPFFHDGFETGDFSKWTQNNGLVVQQANVHTGANAAQAASDGSAGASAYRTLVPTETNLYYAVRFKVLGQSANINLMRVRSTSSAAALVTLYVTTTNRIGLRNDVGGVATTSTAVASPGVWHTAQLHVRVDGGSSLTEVWLDGVSVPQLSLSGIDLGSNPIGRIELGDPSPSGSIDVALDEVAYDRGFLPDVADPTAPTGLAASSPSGFEVDLTWNAGGDDVGITGYDIYRNDSLVGSVGAVTSYADTTVSPLTSYTYKVVAKDAAGHASPPSGNAFVTTGDVFIDNFESGNLSKWTTVNGLAVQQALVDGGQWAARSTSDGTAGASAAVLLDSTVSELYYRVRFQIVSQGPNSVSLLRFRTAGNSALASAFVSNAGKLSYRNDVDSTFFTSAQTVSRGVWHELQMRLLVGSGLVEIWLDGIKVITRSESFGASAIGKLELGDPATGRTYDVVFDGVVANPVFIADHAVPTPPSNLHTTGTSTTQIGLAWDPGNDDVGVTGYRVYRNGAPIGDVDGLTLTYTDTGLSAGTTYTYVVTSLDAVGHESPASNSVSATTGAADTTPPVVVVPASFSVNATSPAGATVTYIASATDNLDPHPTLTCSKASGTVFPIGTTTVTCRAVDASGNTAAKSFNVTVKGAAAQFVDLIDKTVTMLKLPALSAPLKASLQTAASCVIAKKKSLACGAMNLYIAGVKYLAAGKKLTTAQVNELVADATRIKNVIGC